MAQRGCQLVNVKGTSDPVSFAQARPELLSFDKKQASTRMTYQTQRADLGGQGRRGTDLTTGAPQVYCRKKRSAALHREPPGPSLLPPSFRGWPHRLSLLGTAPRASAGSEEGFPTPQRASRLLPGVDRSKRHVGLGPSVQLRLPRPALGRPTQWRGEAPGHKPYPKACGLQSHHRSSGPPSPFTRGEAQAQKALRDSTRTSQHPERSTGKASSRQQF